jgi:alanine racemase
MALYLLQDIARIVGAAKPTANNTIEYLLTDSRKLLFPAQTLFFALPGPRRDGHGFIDELYTKGVRCFVIDTPLDEAAYPDATGLVVPDVKKALQALAAHHRRQFHYPVVGITGSNGKTIVKEWLYQLLQEQENIVRSPRSYNSQIGVPLSLWQMHAQHSLGIFEAGISQQGEMLALSEMIQPDIAVLTNIGEAHNEGFTNHSAKANEKALLFQHAGKVVVGIDQLPVSFALQPAKPTQHLFRWSRKYPAELFITKETIQAGKTKVDATYQDAPIQIIIPFTDHASIDNAITCWAVCLAMGYAQAFIEERMLLLQAVDMRMQLRKAINNCFLLNDSYSYDLNGLSVALDYIDQQAGGAAKMAIISDLLQTGVEQTILYQRIASELQHRGFSTLIAVGPEMLKHQQLMQQNFSGTILHCTSTEDLLKQLQQMPLRDQYILLKGARVFEFERISHWLEKQLHQTSMEINLSALAYNLQRYQSKLRKDVQLMAMVKAFGYGSGGAEIARVLEFHKVHYLAVAYADEGIELRKAGIGLPIMVMNPEPGNFDSLLSYSLEPELYGFSLLQAFVEYLQSQAIQQFPVHIKFNTGMNRLGFEVEDAEALAAFLAKHPEMVVRTVFSHLVASENPAFADFTLQQAAAFEKAAAVLAAVLPYPFVRHIANTAAIAHYPQMQYEMVRLGIGLYGVDQETEPLGLQTVTTLKTTIAQIRKVPASETVGYGRAGILHRDSLIATVRIGYADGYSRRLGNGKAYMLVNGQKAPVVGNVCMDMTMLDVTDIPDAAEGQEVEVFGSNLPVQQIARWADTIAYEVLTGVGQRVKRIYIAE